MTTIPVILDRKPASQEIANDTLTVLTPEKKDPDVKHLEVGKLRKSLSMLTENATELFKDIKKVGDFQLKEVQLQVEITAEGGFALIGSAKAGISGAITLSFKAE